MRGCGNDIVANHWPSLRSQSARIATAIDFVQRGRVVRLEISTLQELSPAQCHAAAAMSCYAQNVMPNRAIIVRGSRKCVPLNVDRKL